MDWVMNDGRKRLALIAEGEEGDLGRGTGMGIGKDGGLGIVWNQLTILEI